MRTAHVLHTVLAAVALAYLVAMVATGARPRQAQFVAFEAAGVMAADPATVATVELQAGARRWLLQHTAQGWRVGPQPLAESATAHLELALKFLHTARPVRSLQGDDVAEAAEYGLASPALRAALSMRDGTRFAVDFGDPSSDGMLQYLRVDGDSGTYLMSRFVGEEWQAVSAALP